MPSRWRHWRGGPCGSSSREVTMPRCSTPSCPVPTAISPATTQSFVSCSRTSHPGGCPTGCTGGSSPACTPACASGWWRWPPIPATRRGSSSRSGSPGSPTAWRHPRTCASAASALSTKSWGAPACETGPRRCGRRLRRGCGSRLLTRSLSCAARVAEALGAAGRRLGSDRRLADGLDRVVESGARALADQFHDELAGLVTGTIERWDAAETSSQLELLLGRDLQYIRINGTVVGAAVGLALHAIVLALA